jgi:hypothetical protein
MSCPVRNAAARQNTIPGRKKATSHASRPPSRSIPVKPSTDIAALWATTSAQCPRSGAARAGWRVRQPHPHLLAHEFQILASNGASQPALWPVLPALAGTGGHHAGQISQRRLPDTSPFGHEVLFAGFPDGGQAGPTRRLTEPTAPARPHGRCLQTGGVRQPHPHLLAHVFQMTGFTWEYFGLRVDFGYRAAQKRPGAQILPTSCTTGRSCPTAHRYLPRRRMTAQDYHDRHLARGCLTAPGEACRQPP